MKSIHCIISVLFCFLLFAGSATAIDQVVVSAPTGTIDTTTPTIVWENVVGAAKYEIWISPYNNNSERLCDAQVAAPNLSYNLTIPLAHGAYKLWVRAFDQKNAAGAWSAPLEFTVYQELLAPSIEDPSTYYVSNTPMFTWSAVDHATSYNYFLRKQGTKVTLLDSYTEDFGVEITEPLEPANYEFWVRAVNNTNKGPWSEVKKVSTLSVVNIVSPSSDGDDFVYSATDSPLISWEATTVGVKYEIFIAKKSTPNTSIVNQIVSEKSFQVISKLPKDYYMVWVREVGTGNNKGPWSSPARFTNIKPLAKVTGIEPEGTIYNFQPTFTWSPVADASEYEIWFALVGRNKQTLLYNQKVSATSFQVSDIIAPGFYNFQVRAVGESAIGTWSPATYVTIGLRRPDILSAIGNTSYPPTYNWSLVDGANKYFVWISTANNENVALEKIFLKGTDQYTSNISLPSGLYRWWVQAIYEPEDPTLTRTIKSRWSAGALFSIGQNSADCSIPGNCSFVDPVCNDETDGSDRDSDGVPDCRDQCPEDPFSNSIEECPCGYGIDPNESDKGCQLYKCLKGPTPFSVVGCLNCGEVIDEESQSCKLADDCADCEDECPLDSDKKTPGVCGCGIPDIDSDGDGKLDCLDACPQNGFLVKTNSLICDCKNEDVKDSKISCSVSKQFLDGMQIPEPNVRQQGNRYVITFPRLHINNEPNLSSPSVLSASKKNKKSKKKKNSKSNSKSANNSKREGRAIKADNRLMFVAFIGTINTETNKLKIKRLIAKRNRISVKLQKGKFTYISGKVRSIDQNSGKETGQSEVSRPVPIIPRR